MERIREYPRYRERSFLAVSARLDCGRGEVWLRETRQALAYVEESSK